MAQLSSNMDIEPLGEMRRLIIFDEVTANIGKAYNKYSGVFTAPFNAAYHFNLDISSPPRPGTHQLNIKILINGNVTGYIFLNDHQEYWIRRTSAITAYLSAGDTVQVVVV